MSWSNTSLYSLSAIATITSLTRSRTIYIGIVSLTRSRVVSIKIIFIWLIYNRRVGRASFTREVERELEEDRDLERVYRGLREVGEVEREYSFYP